MQRNEPSARKMNKEEGGKIKTSKHKQKECNVIITVRQINLDFFYSFFFFFVFINIKWLTVRYELGDRRMRFKSFVNSLDSVFFSCCCCCCYVCAVVAIIKTIEHNLN